MMCLLFIGGCGKEGFWVELLVARHAETLWNAQNRVCGRTDLPLTEKGIGQAKQLAEAVKGRGVDLIFSSPMRRARETAAFAAEACGAPVIPDERLIEQHYGIYEGKSRQDPGFLNNKRQFAFRYPGGESMMQVAGRVYGFLEEIRKKYPDKTVLVVSHGGVCRVLHTYFEDVTNEEFFHFSMKNTELRCYRL